MRFFGVVFGLFWSVLSFADMDIDKACQGHECAVVIDVGSGGSRLYVYAYDQSSEHISALKSIYLYKITPGFSSLEPSTVQNYIETLFHDIKLSKVRSFPVYFYATAGMRLLSEAQQALLYEQLKKWFEQHSEWSLKEARTITGDEEGIFAWISMNEQLGHLSQTEDPSLLGMVEVGGASIQVVFPVDEGTEEGVLVLVGNKRYRLSVHSFLGLGINELRKIIPDGSSCLPFIKGDAELCRAEVFNYLKARDDFSLSQKLSHAPQQWYLMGAMESLVLKKPLDIQQDLSLRALFDKINQTYCQPEWSLQKDQYSDDPFLENNCLLGSAFYTLMTDAYGFDAKKSMILMSKKASDNWTRGVVLMLGHEQG